VSNGSKIVDVEVMSAKVVSGFACACWVRARAPVGAAFLALCWRANPDIT